MVASCDMQRKPLAAQRLLGLGFSILGVKHKYPPPPVLLGSEGQLRVISGFEQVEEPEGCVQHESHEHGNHADVYELSHHRLRSEVQNTRARPSRNSIAPPIAAMSPP